MVLLLHHLQISGIPSHALRHMVQKVVKSQVSLLLCCDNESSGIGREGGEAWIGE
jgi:hypothetical protein